MLSVCIIARDAEKSIERCLASLSGYGFELVVVDTGSVDGTREIVKKFTDNLYEFAWCDDFAAAKNYAISKAGNDIVLLVDSDEFLEPLTEAKVAKLKQLIHQNPTGVGRISCRNVFVREGVQQETQEWVNRIFDRTKFQYEGRIHEQLVALKDNSREIVEQNKELAQDNLSTWLSPLTILHTGYNLTPKEREQKAKRNIKLLKIELAEVMVKLEEQRREGILENKDLEEPIPYLLYQLGKSYYMAGDYKLACEYFDRGLSFDLNPKLEYVIDMVETYGYALINGGQEQKALFFENIYREFGNSADFQFLMGLIYMKNARFDAAIGEFEKALKKPHCRSVGVNSYAANYNIGVIYECLGAVEKAREYYQKCGDYMPARRRLEME